MPVQPGVVYDGLLVHHLAPDHGSAWWLQRDVDWYALDAQEGEWLELRSTGPLDLCAAVYGPELELERWYCPAFHETELLLGYLVDRTGRWYIEFTGLAPGGYRFAFELTEAAPDPLVASDVVDLVEVDDDAGSGGDAGDTPGGALIVTPGSYEGRLLQGKDQVDYYGFHAYAGQGIRVNAEWESPRTLELERFQGLPVGGDGWLRLFAPDGTPVPMMDGRGFEASQTGTWRLMFERGRGLWDTAVSLPYWFTVEVVDRDPQDDAGSGRDAGLTIDDSIPLTVGRVTGELGAFDRMDTYRVDLAGGEAALVRLTAASDPMTALESAPVSGNASWKKLASGAVALTAENASTLTVTVQGGSGPYELEVAWSHHPGMAAYEVIDRSTRGYGLMVPHGDEVDVFTRDELFRASPDGVAPTGLHFTDVVDAARDDQGRLFLAQPGDVRWSRNLIQMVASTEEQLISHAHGGFLAFGHDEALYTYPSSEAEFGPAPAIYRITPDRDVSYVADLHRATSFPGYREPLPPVQDLVSGPDGRLYLITEEGLHRYDPTTRKVDRIYTPIPVGNMAFDMVGDAYVVEKITGTLHRMDMETGATEWVGQAVPPGAATVHVAAAAQRLYVTWLEPSEDRSEPSTWTSGIAYVNLSTPGFPGFQPPFEPLPLPDLTITSLEVRREPPLVQHADVRVENDVDEFRRVVVEVANLGAGPSPRHAEVQAAVLCGGHVEAAAREWPIHLEEEPPVLQGHPLLQIIWHRAYFVNRLAEHFWDSRVDRERPDSPHEDRWVCGESLGTLILDERLEPGERATVEFMWDTSLAVGDHWVLATVDIHPYWPRCEGPGVVVESDDANNCAYTQTSVRASSDGFGASVPYRPWS